MPNTEQSSPRQQTLLFVEDSKEFSDLLKELRRFVDAALCGNMQLVTLQTLDMAKHVLATGNVALIVADLALPDSPQVATVEWIINEHGHLPPIYVLTGDERIDLRTQCLLGGAAGFAIKRHALESPNLFFANLYNVYILSLKDNGNRP